MFQVHSCVAPLETCSSMTSFSIIVGRPAVQAAVECKMAPKVTKMGIEPNKPLSTKGRDQPPRNIDAAQSTRSAEFRLKLQDTIDALRNEGRKHGATVPAHTIIWLAHHLQKLTEEWTNESDGQSELAKRGAGLE